MSKFLGKPVRKKKPPEISRCICEDNVKMELKYSVILSVLDPRKCEYLKDYSLDFEHAYMTTYLAS